MTTSALINESDEQGFLMPLHSGEEQNAPRRGLGRDDLDVPDSGALGMSCSTTLASANNIVSVSALDLIRLVTRCSACLR